MRKTCGISCGLAVLAVVGLAANAQPEPAAEVKWARGVANDFWKAFLGSSPEAAAGLLSPELSKGFETAERPFPSDQWVQKSAGDYLKALRDRGRGYWFSKAAFDSEEIAPGKSEVILKGKLSGLSGFGDKKQLMTADFTMRIARETTGGRWSIRFLVIDNYKEMEIRNPEAEPK